MAGGEMKKRKKVDSEGSSCNVKLFVDKHAKKRFEFQQNDSFMYPMNAIDISTLNKIVGVISGAKWGKCVKQTSTVSQVVGDQVGYAVGTSVVRQTLQTIVEKLEAQFEKFKDETMRSFQRQETKLDCFYKDFKE
ncbi:unnamed protein product [Ilex paraguariensis]|uniref:Uncharacterized protein n=1 Tax=Ilex paraguariensis TaxID=185542 RepID=A0ABC8TN58_9AQUA